MVRAARVARRLFRAQVAHGADDLPGERVLLARVQLAVKDARGAEVDQPCTVPTPDQDVRGLEVAVDDAEVMGHPERLGDRDQHLEPALCGHALLAAVLADVLAVDVLHDEVRGTVLQRPRRAERDKGRVTQAGKEAPLAAETRSRAAAGRREVHELDGDQLAGLDLPAKVDDADAATTQFADGLVAVRKLERWNDGRNLDAGAVPRGTGILVGADQ